MEDSQYTLPKITLRDFNFSKFLNEENKLEKNNHGSLPKLFTVAQSLQDAYVYRNLKPELGTLHQFLSGTVQLRQETKKKKNDRPEETQQRRIRSHMQLHKRNPEDILKMKDATLIQRKVACKVLLEDIFLKQFGKDIEQFCSQPVTQYCWADIPKSIQRFREKYSNPPGLQVELDDFLVYQQHNEEEETQQKTEAKKILENEVYKEQQENRRVITYSRTRVKLQLQKLKEKYKTATKIITTGLEQDFQPVIELRQQSYQKVEEYEQEEEYKRQSRLINSPYRQQTKSLMAFSSKYFVLRSIPMEPQVFIHLIANHTHFESIKKVHIESLSIPEEILCILLDMLLKLSLQLESLTIIGMTIGSRTIELISNTLATSPLKCLSLISVKMTTKMFCQLCLGVGQSSSIETIEVSHNNIDSRALKSVHIISRYISQLRYLDLSYNKLTQLDDKTLKLINQNKKFIIVGESQPLQDS